MHVDLGPELEGLGRQIVHAAYLVHSHFGPGMLESLYETCLCHELTKAGIEVQRQALLPVTYDGLLIEHGFRVDLWVAGKIIVELKAVDKILPVHEAQLITYLKLSESQLGYLINFNVPRIKDGIHRKILT